MWARSPISVIYLPCASSLGAAIAQLPLLKAIPMAKSKRKTVAQTVVDTAGVALPSPVRSVVGTRWGARIVVVGVLALLGTGVATIDWDGWRPKLKFDQKRLEEVREEVRGEVKLVAERMGDKPKPPEPPRPLEKFEEGVKRIGARITKEQSK
jgi:hypothetical protein